MNAIVADGSLHGLTCPNCGGVVPIPEGQILVQCPYCDLRSMVRGQRGILRYQAPLRVDNEAAVKAMHNFLKSSMAIAPAARRQARLSEAFVVYLPFWTVWGRVAGWAFGEEKVGSGDDARYKPREIRIVQDITWNGAACDVGEFGVTQVPPVDQDLQPFDPDELHAAGMVFEPVSSFSQARQAAQAQFEETVRRKADLDRLSQLFVRTMRERAGLVYHPLWVMRYTYRGRAFQVVVDGYTGDVLYGKAPGNTVYRAGILVAGMAIGAFLALDVPVFLFSVSDGNDGSGLFFFALAMFAVGLGIMFAAYRAFRYGELYEYHYHKKGALNIPGFDNPLEMISDVKDVEKWISQLS